MSINYFSIQVILNSTILVSVSSYGVVYSSLMSRSKSLQANLFPLIYTITCFKFKVLNQYGEKLIRKFVSINYFSIQVILVSTTLVHVSSVGIGCLFA